MNRRGGSTHSTEGREEEQSPPPESKYAVAFFTRKPDSTAVCRMAPIETNINLPPLGAWCRDHDYSAFFERSSDTLYSSSLHLGDAFAFDEPKANFAGSGAALKKLLMIPYAVGGSSLVCHKVGNTIYLDLDKDKNDMYRKRLCAKNIIKSFPPSYNVMPYYPGLSMYENLIWHSKECTDEESTSNSTELALVDRPGALFPRMFHSYSYKIKPQDSLNGEAYLWEFHDTVFLADTNLPIFGGGQFPGITIRLSEEEKPISVLTGVDLMLDQLMVHVRETIVVYHSKGVVKEYDVVVQDEIPHMTSSEFDPTKLRNITENMYSFLSKNMTEQGHTYWLCRERGSDELKLYDLTVLCPDLAASTEWNPFLHPVVSLLYKVGSKLLAETREMRSEKVSNVAYGLLSSASNLLNEENLPGYDACINYLIAGIYLTHGMTPPDERQLCQDHLLHGLDDVLFSSSYSKMPAIVKIADLVKEEDCTGDNGLSIPHKIPNSGPFADCCEQALDHCLKALRALEQCRNDDESEENKLFIPYVADTLDDLNAYESHKQLSGDVLFDHLRHSILIRAATAYTSLTNHSIAVNRFDKVFYYSKTGIQCVGSVMSSNPVARHVAVCHALLPHLLSSLLWAMYGLKERVNQSSQLTGDNYRDLEIQKLAFKHVKLQEKHNYSSVWNLPENIGYSHWMKKVEKLINKCIQVIGERWTGYQKVEYFVVRDSVCSLDKAACRVSNVCMEHAMKNTESARKYFLEAEEDHHMEMCEMMMENANKYYTLALQATHGATSDEAKLYQAVVTLNFISVKRLKFAILKSEKAPFKEIFEAAEEVQMTYLKAFETMESSTEKVVVDGTSMFGRGIHDAVVFTVDFALTYGDDLDKLYPGKKALFLESALRAKQILYNSSCSVDLITRSGVAANANCCYTHLLWIKMKELKKLNFGSSPRAKELKKSHNALLFEALRHNVEMFKEGLKADSKVFSLRFMDNIDMCVMNGLVSDHQRFELLSLAMQIVMAAAKDGADGIEGAHTEPKALTEMLGRFQTHFKLLLAMDTKNAAIKGTYGALLKKLPESKPELYETLQKTMETALQAFDHPK